ncbi:MAG: hypothetical protein IT167_26055 [Bryobacterales bacterium]|nr:hypothetical protein [Bryobacterales bacterium]
MNPSDPEWRREVVRKALAPGCPPEQELAAYWEGHGENREHLERHVAGCESCAAWLDLRAEFEEGRGTGAEQADVAAIAARLREQTRRLTGDEGGEGRPWWQAWLGWPLRAQLAGALAAVLLVAAAGLQWRSARVAWLEGGGVGGAVRSAPVIRVSPTGDLGEAPREVKWTGVAGAVDYEVTLSEVDGTELWKTHSGNTAAEIPEAVREKMLPRKTLVLRVTARAADGGIAGQSEDSQFRVLAPQP